MSQRRAILCSACRGLISPDERVCPYCRAPLPGLAGASTALDRLFSDMDVLFIVRVAAAALFGAQVMGTYALDPERLTAPRSLLDLGGTSPLVNHLMGSAQRDGLFDGELWRLGTASWLHGNALHLALNLWFAGSLVRQTAIIFGPARTFSLWVLSGAGGMLIASLVGPAAVVGSSTSAFGLMGALAVFGWRRGGVAGKQLRDHVLQQVVWITLLSLGLRSVSHGGHIGGFLAGALIALALPRHEGVPERRTPRLWALGLALGTALCFAAAALTALSSAPGLG